ncbi:MAG: nitrate/nitrite transporter NrtS [Candidatus Limnocylindria bacterium]|nr:nitrate/nitrite transporter NrtS [Candidatus Limnocylindria bacterium]
MPCVVCARPARYGFDDAGRRDLRCTRHALFYPRIRHRALRVAVVVGAVLFAINQLDVVLYGELTAFVAAKIGLTFTVPYAVSTYSALQINRLRQASSV